MLYSRIITGDGDTPGNAALDAEKQLHKWIVNVGPSPKVQALRQSLLSADGVAGWTTYHMVVTVIVETGETEGVSST